MPAKNSSFSKKKQVPRLAKSPGTSMLYSIEPPFGYSTVCVLGLSKPVLVFDELSFHGISGNIHGSFKCFTGFFYKEGFSWYT
jgi:hypothetical protein